MSEHTATQRTTITLEAVVFPICKCGRPYTDPAHDPRRQTEAAVEAGGGGRFWRQLMDPDPSCRGYDPVRPVEDHGVIARGER